MPKWIFRWIGLIGLACMFAQSTTARSTFDIYWVDTEGEGHWIRASVSTDGTFTVTNARNGFSRTYTAR